jgi:hypothetical protein
MTIVLVCPCGARIRAPGAVPGRTGRCPNCGTSLRVPDAELPPAVTAAALEGSPAPAGTTPAGRTRASRLPDARFRESLGYPFREDSGLAVLGILPPLCSITSIFSFGLRDFVFSDSEVMAMGALIMVFPALILFLLVAGIGLRFLEQVVESSARGERRPPRWPRSNVFDIVACLGRWVAAMAVGLAVGIALAWAYRAQAAGLPEAARRGYVELLAAMLLGSSAALWPMAILAVSLHQSPGAANPVSLVVAIVRSGWGSLGISLLFGVAGAATMALAALLYRIPGIVGTGLGIYVFWVFFWYEAIVLMRRLGLFYRRRAKVLGWFRSP